MTAGSDWVEQTRRLMEGLAGSPGATGHGAATAADGDCRWCPLCQAAAMLRGERPEMTAALADILAASATALRQFAGEPTGEPGREPAGGDARPDTAPEESARGGAPAVQRIELS